MASLKEVRIRINSIKSTQKITSAMKMVSASKLRRTQNAILKLRPYAKKKYEMLQNIIENISPETKEQLKLAQKRNIEKQLVVVITSNRGLCGAFNANVTKKALSHLAEIQKTISIENIGIITIGKKGNEALKRAKYDIDEHFDDILDSPAYSDVTNLADKLMDAFISKKFDKIEIIYNQFKNAATQELVIEQFLPVDIETEENIKKSQNSIEYIFQPDKELILNDLFPQTLQTQFYQCILNSITSEHGARMTAMHQATENATTLIKELNLSYNKARQSAITNEIVEIVSGAEALSNI